MSLLVQCDHCGTRYRVPETSVGKAVRCKCGKRVRVQTPAERDVTDAPSAVAEAPKKRAAAPWERVAAALPALAWSGIFLFVWNWPTALGERMVRHLVYVMLVEFILIHATGAVGWTMIEMNKRKANISNKGCVIAAFLLLYLPFALSISALYGSLWPLLAVLWLILSKCPMLVAGVAEDAQTKGFGARWVTMTFTFLMGTGLTLFLPVPRLGVTPEVVAALEFTEAGGDWVEQPHRVLAFGVLYFGVLGFSELIGFAKAGAFGVAEDS